MPAPRSLLAALVVAAIAAAARAELMVAVFDDGRLVTYDSGRLPVVSNERTVTGLDAGEAIVAVDFRPGTETLFALGSRDRLYVIDRVTGVATPVGPAFTPALVGPGIGLAFEDASTIRVVTETGQNVRVDPDTGAAISVDSPLVYAPGESGEGTAAQLCALAATGGDLYALDVQRGRLVRLGAAGESPSLGLVHTVGTLGVTGAQAGELSGFDVSPETGKAYVALDADHDTVSRLYEIDLATGATTLLGLHFPRLAVAAAVAPPTPLPPPPQTLLALVGYTDVLEFSSATPGALVRTIRVKGVPAGESLQGIAVRPSDGVLHAFTRAALYTIDVTLETAARVGPGFGQSLAGTDFGCDFDPSTGRLRIVAGGATNFRVDTATGLLVDSAPGLPGVQGDQPFAFAAGDVNEGASPAVGALGFTGRATPSVPSQALVLEAGAAVLARLGAAGGGVDAASTGALATTGPLPPAPPVLGPVGFETADESWGYATFVNGDGGSDLWRVDLAKGDSTRVGTIASPLPVRSLSRAPTANPSRARVDTLKIDLVFRRTGRDRMKLRGVLPLPDGALAGRTLTVDVGGATRTFTLNARGRGKSGRDVVRVGGPAVDGVVLKLDVERADLVASLADERMDGSATAVLEPRSIDVVYVFDGRTLTSTLDLVYSAVPGRKGSARSL